MNHVAHSPFGISDQHTQGEFRNFFRSHLRPDQFVANLRPVPVHDDEATASGCQTDYTFKDSASVGELRVNVARLALSDYRIPSKSENC